MTHMKGEIHYEGMINPARREAKFVERVDSRGRVFVPRMIRDKLGIKENDIVAIFLKVIEEEGEEEWREE